MDRWEDEWMGGWMGGWNDVSELNCIAFPIL